VRKANAILEYGVLIVIVVGAMAGINLYLKRHIQARLKRESDALLGHGQGLEWQASISYSTSSSDSREAESQGANFDINTQSQSGSVTYTPPTPPYIMEHKGSALHVQDAATKPPEPDYPDLEYDKWSLRNAWTKKEPIG